MAMVFDFEKKAKNNTDSVRAFGGLKFRYCPKPMLLNAPRLRVQFIYSVKMKARISLAGLLWEVTVTLWDPVLKWWVPLVGVVDRIEPNLQSPHEAPRE